MEAGRYYLAGYGPVDVEAETLSGQDGFSYRRDGAHPNNPRIKNWCSPVQAAMRLTPMAKVRWEDVLEAMRGQAEPIEIRVTTSSKFTLQEIQHGTPTDVAQGWARLRVSSACHTKQKCMAEVEATLGRLFAAAECPEWARQQGRALMAQPLPKRAQTKREKERSRAA